MDLLSYNSVELLVESLPDGVISTLSNQSRYINNIVYFDEKTMNDIQDILKTNELNLRQFSQRVHLGGNQYTGVHVKDIDGNQQFLDTLILSNITGIKFVWEYSSTDTIDGYMRKLAEILPKTKLKRLSLYSSKIGDNGIKYLADVLPRTNIEVLEFLNLDFTDDGLTYL